MAADNEQTHKDFKDAVNMSAAEIEKFLDTPESKEVGWKGEGGHDEDEESVGHKSGKRIVQILHAKKGDLAEDDYAHMRKVVSYVHRHMAQGPAHDVETSR